MRVPARGSISKGSIARSIAAWTDGPKVAASDRDTPGRTFSLMSLRIACDLDGTVADMDSALQREAQRLFGPDVDLNAASPRPLESAEDVEREVRTGEGGAARDAAAAVPRSRALSRPELKQLWAHVGQMDNFWRSLEEIEPGAVARLASLATNLRWEVLFLTQRPPSAGEIAQVQSQRWLNAHGFEFPSVFVMNGSRGHVAKALSLDAVMDDRPENCLDVAADSMATPFLIWRMPPSTVPPGIVNTRIQPVFSMAEALDRLEKATVDRRSRKTLMGRVKSAIGL